MYLYQSNTPYAKVAKGLTKEAEERESERKREREDEARRRRDRLFVDFGSALLAVQA